MWLSFEEWYELYFLVSLPFFWIANSLYGVILALGFFNARRQFRDKLLEIPEHLSPLRSLKPISILVPCYNEEETVVSSLRAMLMLDYPDFEVIVINDGSTDKTLQVLIEHFELVRLRATYPMPLPTESILGVYRCPNFPNFIVVDKENGGKSDALNAGINHSQYPLICSVDADSIIDSNGLSRVTLPFIEDDTTIATGGTVLLANPYGNKVQTGVDTSIAWSYLLIIQSVEYLRAFLVGRLGWDQLGTNTIISGAFGLFRKSLVMEIGGYANKTIGEDMELLMRMHSHCVQKRRPYKVKLLPDPICWTEPPTDMGSLGRQRQRWTQGMAESLFLHRNLIFNLRSKRIGWLALPYQLFFELVSAPMEIIGYVLIAIGLATDLFQMHAVAAFFCVTILYGCILNLGAILIDQFTFRKYHRPSDVLKLILGSILEHFGYRQIHLFWRLKGLTNWVRGKRQWGTMQRKGLNREKLPDKAA